MKDELIQLSGEESEENKQAYLKRTKKYTYFIYHQKAASGYHLPQDAIGLKATDKHLHLVVSDGVTIVNSRVDNDSGIVSQKVSQLAKFKPAKIPKKLKKLTQKVNQLNGAATFIYGSLDLQKKDLILYTISRDKDIGSIFISKKGNLQKINSRSNNFFPYNFQPAKQEFPKINQLVFASDGLLLNKPTVLKMFNLLENKQKDKQTLLKLIKEEQIASQDDQSLVLVSC